VGGFPELKLIDKDVDPATGRIGEGNPDAPAFWAEPKFYSSKAVCATDLGRRTPNDSAQTLHVRIWESPVAFGGYTAPLSTPS
jgi:hypothetical protein